MTRDWPKFYRALDSLVVPIPETAPGEPVDPAAIERLLVKVQNSRETCDRTGRKILMHVGIARRKLDATKHELRVQKAAVMCDPSVVPPSATNRQRSAIADGLTLGIADRVSRLQGEVAELEAARDAVDMTLRTLDRAKETLNALHRGAVADLGGGNVNTNRRF